MVKSLIKILIIVFTVSYGFLFAQNNITYEARLKNDFKVTSNQYEFDIFIKHTGGIDTFKVFGLQVALLINDSISNGGSLSANYIPGTSEMNSAQVPSDAIIAPAIVGIKVLQIAAKFAIQSDQGTIISKVGNGTRLGRFRIATSSSIFAPFTGNISWSFDQQLYGYSTLFIAFIEDDISDITDSTMHFIELLNPVLPIELSSFTAACQERDIILNWQTKTEINSSQFEIQRQSSLNSQSSEWIKVGSLPASGNSNSPKNYSYLDKKLNIGKFNYRLKIIDNDGTFRYSGIVNTEVELPKEFAISQNYPNPFNPTSRIDFQLPFDSKVTIELYDIIGEKVAAILNGEFKAGYFTTEINANFFNLASGIYIYRFTAQHLTNSNTNAFVQVKKLVLMK